ncbi:PP2C family protein-serine/threonine phosphatase [Paractinoplanes atraurantiacus]|uniref:Stage II sporulation protein E (SpoIIE) n=1 Tax=Paractinoplanes atraurantiacus TaxID=1036182 RepID=A0A285KKR8_9ACTN|nr:PP2C family protein-serine/threonine phosphatase [Actinoplanes atraurantiacus]SNY71871.1 Stage II sporulation protein E (SpoIIE) [Actinoplanes atraurantiacus]
MAGDEVARVVQEMLAVIPTGCSWLLPVSGDDGTVRDFRVGAASGRGRDIYRRGTSRVGRLLSELYPSIVGGELWQIYLDVLRTGEPAEYKEFGYDEKKAGVVAHSQFDVTVHPVLGGLLVWWQRLDEDRRRMANTELLGSLGWTEFDLVTGASDWSPGMYRIFERDPALGPMSRVEQAAAMLPEDRGIAETAWQSMDSGGPADVTVRFAVGSGVKHLRILSDVATDAGGRPLKINAVVQDVTARESSRTAIDRLRDQLRTREMTAIAEHRLAGQLQHMIQPVPREPFPLPGLRVLVDYQPAESTVQVGGDWYHAQELADGRVLLAVGDVAGHGLAAASGMAHLRFALIAWLSIGVHDPALLLRHLNRLCGQLRLTGTAVLGVFDPVDRTLAWGRAGHAPPLLARGGHARPLDLPVGLLLGADGEAAYEIKTLALDPDDLLLFYTDGLVERRSGPPLLPRVLGALAAATDALPAVTAINRPSPDDDTCTVTVRVL